MPLNLSTGGEFMPYIKFNAKLGQWLVKGEDNMPDVIIPSPRMAMDMANVKTGWIIFSPAGPPQHIWDVNGIRQPLPDGVRAKDGFEVMVHGPDPQPGLGGHPVGFRVWSSNAAATKEGFVKAYSEWEAQSGEHPDEVPIFQMTGVQKIGGQHGDSFAPVFSLTGWVARSKVPEFTAAQQTNGHAEPAAVQRTVQETANAMYAPQAWPGPDPAPQYDEDLADDIPY